MSLSHFTTVNLTRSIQVQIQNSRVSSQYSSHNIKWTFYMLLHALRVVGSMVVNNLNLRFWPYYLAHTFILLYTSDIELT